MVTEELMWISRGPTNMPIKHDAILVKGRRFNCKTLDDVRVNQNSGVSITAHTVQDTGRDEQMTYYGVIQEIWELDYCAFRIPVFKCEWYSDTRTDKDDFNLTMVNLKKTGHNDDPFILATQARQVFYVDDPMNKGWSIVLTFDPRNVTDDDDDLEDGAMGFEFQGDQTEKTAITAATTAVSYVRKDVDPISLED